jgi:uncharacterized membrane protein YphA (DoxX/SURF4 family)
MINRIFPIWAYLVLRWALGLIFLSAGATKLFAPEMFAVVIDAYGLLPETLVLPAAIALPLLEVVAAIGLLLDVRGSLGAITALLVMFMVILGYGLWLGLDVDCGCFGPEDPETAAYAGLRPAFYRDMVMLLGIAYLYAWRRRHAVIRRFLHPTVFRKEIG